MSLFMRDWSGEALTRN